MSLEDDTDNAEIELRDLVAQTLEENGLLAKIRAQLRAGLYLALENEINTSEDQSTYNASLKSKLAIPEFQIIFCLVREFLEYFDLSYTCSVFEKETFMGSTYRYDSREKLIQDLDIGIDTLHNAPLLLEVLNIARSSFNLSARGIHNESNFDNSTLNADGSKLAHNVTYEVPSPVKTPNQSVNSDDGGSVRNDSMSESLASEIAQPVIGVKTVPKQYVNGVSDTPPLKPKQNGASVHETSPNQDKSESVSEHMDSHQSEVQVSSRKVMQLSKQTEEVEYKFETDDTYEGTSSIAEDSVVSNNKEHSMLIDFDKSVKLPVNVPNSPPTLTAKHIIDQTLDDTVRSPKLSFSPENPLSDKRKLDKSDRVEKLKPMNSLTSLSDLPPLPVVTKSRNADTVLLPSLYSKDFREKSTKDIDKLLDINFDSLDNYEEDFMSSGSLDNEDAVNNSFIPKQTKSLKVKNDNKTKPSELSGRQQHTVKQPLKELSTADTKQNVERTNKVNKQQPASESNDSSNRESSISEDFDLNSNVDDLLKSASTT